MEDFGHFGSHLYSPLCKHAGVAKKDVSRRLHSKFVTFLLVLALHLMQSNAADTIQSPPFDYMKNFLSFTLEFVFSIVQAGVGQKDVSRRLNSEFATCLFVLAICLTQSNADETIQSPPFNGVVAVEGVELVECVE
jgi:hypothetical protein